jgi:hypothetical protein
MPKQLAPVVLLEKLEMLMMQRFKRLRMALTAQTKQP